MNSFAGGFLFFILGTKAPFARLCLTTTDSGWADLNSPHKTNLVLRRERAVPSAERSVLSPTLIVLAVERSVLLPRVCVLRPTLIVLVSERIVPRPR